MQKTIQRRIQMALMLLAIVALAGCQSVPRKNTLYDQLGGMQSIEKIVDGFIFEIGFDEEIVRFFGETDLQRFRTKLIEQICEISGGPCQYSGDSMQEVHANMEINEAEFNRTVDLLIASMNKNGIPFGVQNQLIALLAPLRSDIIYR